MKTFAFALLVALKVSLSNGVRLQMLVEEVSDKVAAHPDAAAKVAEHGHPDVPDAAIEHHPDHVPDAVKEHHPDAAHTKAVAGDAIHCDAEAEKAFFDELLGDLTC